MLVWLSSVEQCIRNAWVGGSSPFTSSINKTFFCGKFLFFIYNNYFNSSEPFCGDKERSDISSENGGLGYYVSVDFNTYDEMINYLKDELVEILGDDKNKKTLVIGLGNWNITSDALGPKSVSKTLVTRHIFKNYNKKLHKLLLKIGYKLIQNNPKYQFVYESAIERYQKKYKNRTTAIYSNWRNNKSGSAFRSASRPFRSAFEA